MVIKCADSAHNRIFGTIRSHFSGTTAAKPHFWRMTESPLAYLVDCLLLAMRDSVRFADRDMSGEFEHGRSSLVTRSWRSFHLIVLFSILDSIFPVCHLRGLLLPPNTSFVAVAVFANACVFYHAHHAEEQADGAATTYLVPHEKQIKNETPIQDTFSRARSEIKSLPRSDPSPTGHLPLISPLPFSPLYHFPASTLNVWHGRRQREGPSGLGPRQP